MTAMFEEELSLNREEPAYVPPPAPVVPPQPRPVQPQFPPQTMPSQQQGMPPYQAPAAPQQPVTSGFVGMPQQARSAMPQQYQQPMTGGMGQAPQFQGVNLMAGKPKRIPGAPLLSLALSLRLAKDEDGAHKVLLVFALVFAGAAVFSAWYFFRTPGGDDSKYPIMYFEDVTPAQLNLIPPEDREAYLQSLPSKK